MDPLSQAIAGATAAALVAKKGSVRLAIAAGAFAGIIADADTLIFSKDDPLLQLDYHRHFTHSLIFIPFGGLLAALLSYPVLRYKLAFRKILLYSIAGYSTSGLLDACTSYGTHLLWPFSDTRIAWSVISIVDPVFTIGAGSLLLCALLKRNRKFGFAAAIFALSYLGFGLVQHRSAEAALQELAVKRGHSSASRFLVKPTIGNLLLWRGVYLSHDHFHLQAIRVSPFSSTQIYEGPAVPQTTLASLSNSSEWSETLETDATRFFHFSDDYVAISPERPGFLIDLRYSTLPHSLKPIWGLDLSELTEAGHAKFKTEREFGETDKAEFLDMLRGRDISGSE